MMLIIKTWANSWSTSERYQEDLCLGCVFGCNGYALGNHIINFKDELSHYLACPILWAIICSVERAPSFQWDLDAPERACFVNQNISNFKRLCVAFKVYHALRMDYRNVLIQATGTGDFDAVHMLFIDLARHFCDEHALHHVD